MPKSYENINTIKHLEEMASFILILYNRLFILF